jgi:hypothetical protein
MGKPKERIHPMMINKTAEVLRLYETACRQGTMSKIWATLTGHSRRLFDLETVRRTVNVRNRHYAGVQTVAIRHIRGSEGRSRQFDGYFHPLQTYTQHRWLSIAVAYKQGQPLPPVELIKIGDIYFVRDGHHRISVAQMMGQEHIDAEVTVWETAAPLPCCDLASSGVSVCI